MYSINVDMVDNNSSSRRTVLKTLGAAGAVVGTTGIASAGGGATDAKDDDHDHQGDDRSNEKDADDKRNDADGDAFIRFGNQVTDGTYVIVDEIRFTTPGFVSIHIARPEEDIADVGFINPENGDPQNAAATIIGYSEFFEPGTYEDVEVSLFEDEELDAVSGEIDRLPEPAVLVSLAHKDSNDNREWDFYDEGNEDPAYDFGETQYAPPFDRPTDVAAVIPLEENEDEFEISR